MAPFPLSPGKVFSLAAILFLISGSCFSTAFFHLFLATTGLSTRLRWNERSSKSPLRLPTLDSRLWRPLCVRWGEEECVGSVRSEVWGVRGEGWGVESGVRTTRDEEWGVRSEGEVWGVRSEEWGERSEGWGMRSEGWGVRSKGWGIRCEEWGMRWGGTRKDECWLSVVTCKGGGRNEEN